MIKLLSAFIFLSGIANAQTTPPPALTPEQKVAAARSEAQLRLTQGQLNLQSLDDTFVSNGEEYRISQFREVAAAVIQAETSNIGKETVGAFLANYLTDNTAMLGDFKAFQAACPGTTSECEDREKRRGEVLGNINLLYRAVHGNAGAEKFETEICEATTPTVPNQEFWSQFTNMTLKTNRCAELRANEAKKVTAQGFGAEYLLRKTESGKHQAVMNLNFDYEGGNLSNVDMMNRMRDCLKKANPYMSAAPGMELVILGEDDINRLPANQRPRPAKITLKGPEFRSNSANYSDAAQCPTLVHEALHLLNLCDEYQERDTGSYDWTCRIVTTTDSIMANSFQAFPRSVPQSVTCECADASTCKNVMSSTDETARKIYLAETPQEMANGFFWVDYCTQGNWTQLSSPPTRAVDRGTISADNNSFTVIQRTVGGTAPNFFYHEKVDTCTFQTKQTNPVLIAEERARFVAQRENLLQRVDRGAQTARCPWGSQSKTHEDKLRGTPGATFSGNTLSLNRDSEGKPLLHPNHVGRIIAGNCNDRATNYRRCAELSQKSISSCNPADRAQCGEDNFLRVSGDASRQ